MVSDVINKKLFVPPDIDEAHDVWGANCGPVALAAIIGEPMRQIRAAFPGFKDRGYASPTHMREAIHNAGWRDYPTTAYGTKPGCRIPHHGVAFLQYAGAWWDDRPARVQYKFTHWIGVNVTHGRCQVFDVNAGVWLSYDEWQTQIWPMLAQAAKCQTCYCRIAYEVRKGSWR